MARKIVLLTPVEEFKDLSIQVKRIDPKADILHADTLKILRAQVSGFTADDRVISFATPVIVPPGVINMLPSPAYNFHNGPPAYPGLFPACFAIYDGAVQFGATVHEIVEAVDQGPIVGLQMCDIPSTIDRLHLEALSRELLSRLLDKMLPIILDTTRVPSPLDVAWSKRVTRKPDFDALCQLPEGVDAEEFALRLRAVGEGPFHALRVPLHGRLFRLEPHEDVGPVIKGGKVINE